MEMYEAPKVEVIEVEVEKGLKQCLLLIIIMCRLFFSLLLVG